MWIRPYQVASVVKGALKILVPFATLTVLGGIVVGNREFVSEFGASVVYAVVFEATGAVAGAAVVILLFPLRATGRGRAVMGYFAALPAYLLATFAVSRSADHRTDPSIAIIAALVLSSGGAFIARQPRFGPRDGSSSGPG